MRKTLLLVALFATAYSFSANLYLSTLGNDNNNGQNWNTAKKTLYGAFSVANTGDKIHVAAGTYDFYQPVTLNKNIEIIGSYFVNYNNNTATRSLIAKGKPWEFQYKTIFNSAGYTGSAPNSGNKTTRIIQVSSGNYAINMDGITFQNAQGIHTTSNELGGAVNVVGTGVTIRNCSFKNNGITKINNSSGGHGGAIHITGAADVTCCYFFGNFANDGSSGGGAMFIQPSNGNTANVTQCLFESNTSNVSGAAIRTNKDNKVIIDGCTFVNNVAIDGSTLKNGATIYLAGNLSGTLTPSTDEILNCLFYNNKGATGIILSGGAMKNCTYVNNIGALRCAYQDAVFVHNTVLWGNKSASGSVVAFEITSQPGIIWNCAADKYMTPVAYLNNYIRLDSLNDDFGGPNFNTPTSFYGNGNLSGETPDWSLNLVSPLRLTGSSSDAAGAYDIIGNYRNLNESACSIGAFEHVPAVRTWRSSLYPENWTPGYADGQGRFLHDFSYAGYQYGAVSLPVINTNVVNITLSPYNADNSGNADVTDIIQQAINDLPAGGGVIYLPAGTYKMSVPSNRSYGVLINKDSVVIRGAGTGITKIKNTSVFMRSKKLFYFCADAADWRYNVSSESYIIEDISLPTREVRVENASLYAEGDWVVLRNDVTPGFIAEHSSTGYWTTEGVRGVYFCRQVLAINTYTNTLTLDIPTRYPLKQRDNARVYKLNSQLMECGMEDLSIGNVAHPGTGFLDNDYLEVGTAAYDVHDSHLITVRNAINCWFRRIHTYRPAENTGDFHTVSNCLQLFHVRSITVEDCDFRNSQYEGAGGNGYMYILQGNDCLLKNCHAEHSRHNYSFKHMSANGNVLYNCTSKDPYLATDFHMHLSMVNLIDNFHADGDFIHAGFRTAGLDSAKHMYTTTESVFWNTKSINKFKNESYLIESRQFKNGYVIGTSGLWPNVKLETLTGTQEGIPYDTSPVDFVEGLGLGTTLVPASLYLDQLSKRLQSPDYSKRDPFSSNNSLKQNACITYNEINKVLTINDDFTEYTDFYLFDIVGNKIIGKTISNNDNTVILNKTNPGIYIYAYKNSQGMLVSKKLIVK